MQERTGEFPQLFPAPNRSLTYSKINHHYFIYAYHYDHHSGHLYNHHYDDLYDLYDDLYDDRYDHHYDHHNLFSSLLLWLWLV